MKTKVPDFQVLVEHEPIRPHLPLEWLTKITLGEYNAWAKSELFVKRVLHPKEQNDYDYLEEQKVLKEKLFQSYKLIMSFPVDLKSSPACADAFVGNKRYYPKLLIRNYI